MYNTYKEEQKDGRVTSANQTNDSQEKSTVAKVSRQYDLTPAVIEEWMEEARNHFGQLQRLATLIVL